MTTRLSSMDVIRATYEECLQIAKQVYPLATWCIQPTTIELDTHKSKYGRATPEGVVLINPAFIGTSALNQLRRTIFHELSHLIIGTHHNHNKRFKLVERALVAGIHVPNSEIEEIKNNNNYKYRLIAHTEQGPVDFGGAFVRRAKYSDYHPTPKRFFKINNVKILRFEYTPFKTS